MTQDQRDGLLVRLDVGINGNGVKGLNDRVDDIEDWQKARPQICPVTPIDKATRLKERAVNIALIALIISGLQLAGRHWGWL